VHHIPVSVAQAAAGWVRQTLKEAAGKADPRAAALIARHGKKILLAVLVLVLLYLVGATLNVWQVTSCLHADRLCVHQMEVMPASDIDIRRFPAWQFNLSYFCREYFWADAECGPAITSMVQHTTEQSLPA
jgi:hypothetical protein